MATLIGSRCQASKLGDQQNAGSVAFGARRPQPRPPMTMAGWRPCGCCAHGVLCASGAPGLEEYRVVGCGGAVIDYLALVASYPKPDEKIRSEKLEIQGGGNCGNALTAAARLGLQPVILTKIGDDGTGQQVVSGLQDEGIDTSHVVIGPHEPSPFTYIIVDRTGGTRTCIHTPGPRLDPTEITPQLADALLDGAKLVYFDGRMTEAALVVAEHARAKEIPVLVEAERLRPNLEKLLFLADYVVTSKHFPQDWTGEEALGDALLSTMARLPNAKMLITTLGSRGSAIIERGNSSSGEGAVLEDLIHGMWIAQGNGNSPGGSLAGEVVCISKTQVEIRAGVVQCTDGVTRLLMKRGSRQDAASVAMRARSAAEAAAAANADSGDVDGYAMTSADVMDAEPCVDARVWVGSPAGIQQEAVVDTTGAGDAFIGGVMYGLVQGFEVDRIVQLASVVAACKCTALGARAGSPTRDCFQIDLLKSSSC